MSDWITWINWNGGERPVAPETKVSVRFRSGAELAGCRAGAWTWAVDPHAMHGSDIVAYRVVGKTDGWIEWKGDTCPVSPETMVQVRLRSASESRPMRAGSLEWSVDTECAFSSDIVAYRVVEPGKAPIERALASMAKPTAPDLLGKARQHMEDRAATYDKPEGERSMGKTVQAFNAITDRNLTEAEGWLLLQILKDVRDRQRAEPHVDSLEDCIAYSALKAEARLREKIA